MVREGTRGSSIDSNVLMGRGIEASPRVDRVDRGIPMAGQAQTHTHTHKTVRGSAAEGENRQRRLSRGSLEAI